MNPVLAKRVDLRDIHGTELLVGIPVKGGSRGVRVEDRPLLGVEEQDRLDIVVEQRAVSLFRVRERSEAGTQAGNDKIDHKTSGRDAENPRK